MRTGPNAMFDVLIKRGIWDPDILALGEHHVGKKAEIELHFHQLRTPKITNKPPKLGERQRADGVSQAWEGQPCPHIDLGLLACKTGATIYFCCLRYPVCGT